jgi:hypothetical protein
MGVITRKTHLLECDVTVCYKYRYCLHFQGLRVTVRHWRLEQ